jgi:hypothetical protein
MCTDRGNDSVHSVCISTNPRIDNVIDDSLVRDFIICNIQLVTRNLDKVHLEDVTQSLGLGLYISISVCKIKLITIQLQNVDHDAVHRFQQVTVTYACRKRRLKWVATLPLGI